MLIENKEQRLWRHFPTIKIQGILALFPNRFVNGAEVEQKNPVLKPRVAKVIR